MRDAATLLLALVDAADKAITRPGFSYATELEPLRAKLEAASTNQPDPAGGLLIDVEAHLLAQVLCLAAKQRGLGDEDRADLLMQLAGVLLPSVRQATWRAIQVRRDTRATP